MVEKIKTKRNRTARVKKLLYSGSEAASACGVSVKTWRTWHVLGFIPKPIQIGKSLFWRIDELAKWTEAGCPPREDWTYCPHKMLHKKLSPFSRP